MNEEVKNLQPAPDYPIDPFMEKLSVFTKKVCEDWREKGVLFSIEDESLSDGEQISIISSPICLLPVLAVDADGVHKEMTGESLPYYLYKENMAITYYAVAAHDSMDTNTMALWSHHIDHSLEKAIEKAHPNYKKKLGKETMIVPLDYMLKRYDYVMENNLVEKRNAPLNYKPDQLFKNSF